MTAMDSDWKENAWSRLLAFQCFSVERTKLDERLASISDEKNSSALFVIGPQERNDFVQSSLWSHDRLKHAPCANINGLHCQNESHAMLQIANSFLIRDLSEKNPNLVLRDLEAFLEQRKIQGVPGVIVIDHVEEFAKRANQKQVLLYTLLDLLHNSKLYFVLICLTPCFHISELLEKRVLSRLNAQYIYLTAMNAKDTCMTLSQLLQADTVNAVEETERKEIQEHNHFVDDTFGSAQHNEGTGKLFGLVECCVNWGYGLSWLLNIVKWVVAKALQRPSFRLAIDDFENMIAMQQPPTLLETLSHLSDTEIHLVAAATRLHFCPGRKQTVEEVLIDFDGFTGCLRRKNFSLEMIYISLRHLVEFNLLWLTNGSASATDRLIATQQICYNTSVFLVPLPEEVQKLFKSSSKPSGQGNLKGLRKRTAGNMSDFDDATQFAKEPFYFRPQPLLKISERVREYVLQPHVPIVIVAQNNASAANAAAVI